MTHLDEEAEDDVRGLAAEEAVEALEQLGAHRHILRFLQREEKAASALMPRSWKNVL